MWVTVGDVLHHLSIPTREPERAARSLAELLGGDVTPFGPLPGSWIAWTRDELLDGVRVAGEDGSAARDGRVAGRGDQRATVAREQEGAHVVGVSPATASWCC